MKFYLSFSIAILSISLLGAGCVKKTEPSAQQPSSPVSESITAVYKGPFLSGGETPIIDFNQADYDKAIAEGKLVVLTFYATWCPSCAKQQPEHFTAMEELNSDDVIAFRVNFNDGDTDSNEKALARKYGVGYQDTKVIVKDGKRIVKSPEFWPKSKYLSEINKALGI